MSCRLQDSQPDWKAYVLDELDLSARRGAEAHLPTCDDCRDEVASLRGTLTAMAVLREEEPPRRIAFVSDKVFEPKWWQKLFALPSFAAAALVAGAILVHAFVRPAVTPQVDAAVIEKQVTERVTARLTAEITEKVRGQMASTVQSTVDQAVTRAVAETRQQDDRRTVLLLAAAERRYADSAEFLNKQMTRIYALNSGVGVR